MIPSELTEQLNSIGAVHFERALTRAELAKLVGWSNSFGGERPGERITDLQSLAWLLDEGSVGQVARVVLGSSARAVRAILFDKTPANNWALGWHQDRTIAVQSRADVAGFENWNVKSGVHHVEPPFEYIERMVTARIHLDAVSQDNAPLLIAPGSHRLGKVAESALEMVVGECGKSACLAGAGDIWLYSTAILHASRRSLAKRRRRVLQVDFSADELPRPLRWAAHSIGVS